MIEHRGCGEGKPVRMARSWGVFLLRAARFG